MYTNDFYQRLCFRLIFFNAAFAGLEALTAFVVSPWFWIAAACFVVLAFFSYRQYNSWRKLNEKTKRLMEAYPRHWA